LVNFSAAERLTASVETLISMDLASYLVGQLDSNSKLTKNLALQPNDDNDDVCYVIVGDTGGYDDKHESDCNSDGD
jgi:hypothetical protein